MQAARSTKLIVLRATPCIPLNAAGNVISFTAAPALPSAAAASSTAAIVSGCAESQISVRHNPIRGALLSLRDDWGACMRSTAVMSSRSSIDRA